VCWRKVSELGAALQDPALREEVLGILEAWFRASRYTPAKKRFNISSVVTSPK
jgi:hypothetical protein